MNKTTYFFAYNLYDSVADTDGKVSSNGAFVATIDSDKLPGEVLLDLRRATEDGYMTTLDLPATRRGRISVVPIAFNKV